MPLKFNGKAILPVALSVAVLGLGGCSMDDVALNGKVFDLMGMNTTGSVKTGDPKVAARDPLVIPPGSESLPVPGSGKENQPAFADIQDPDAKKKVDAAQLQRQQDAYCHEHYDPLIARGDDSADAVTGPAGPCHPSIFTAVKKWTSGSEDSD